MDRSQLYKLITAERERQDALWGGRANDEKNTGNDWIAFIVHQLGEAQISREVGFRDRMLKIAALAVAAIEARTPLDT